MVGVYLAGAYSFGIIVPILFFLCGALIGGVIGWVVGLPRKAAAKLWTIGFYAGGFLLSTVVTYRATMDKLVESVYHSALSQNPAMTRAEWAPLYENAVQQSSLMAWQKVIEVVFIVIVWLALYWLVKSLIRKRTP